MTQVFILTLCMMVGSYLSEGFSNLTDFALPDYVGAMFVAVIARNTID